MSVRLSAVLPVPVIGWMVATGATVSSQQAAFILALCGLARQAGIRWARFRVRI